MGVSHVDRARRLARAILADVRLYNETALREGLAGGRTVIFDAMDEAHELYRSRVDPATLLTTRCFDAAIVKTLSGRPAWRFGLDELRRRYLEPPVCAACRVGPLGEDRIAWMGPHDHGWQVLLGCPHCLSVSRIVASGEQNDVLRAADVEASPDVVVRLRERLSKARESDSLETEIREIEGDPTLARLLGVPEVSADAAPPAGRLVLGKIAAVAQTEAAPWPGLPPRLQPAGLPPEFHAGTVFRYVGRIAGGWTFADADGRRFEAPRDMVELRDG